MIVELRSSNFVLDPQGMGHNQIWNYCALYAFDKIEANRPPWIVEGTIRRDDGIGFDDLFPLAFSLDVDFDAFPPGVDVPAVVQVWLSETICPDEDAVHDASLVIVFDDQPNH
jgi:hypothetical protein